MKCSAGALWALSAVCTTQQHHPEDKLCWLHLPFAHTCRTGALFRLGALQSYPWVSKREPLQQGRNGDLQKKTTFHGQAAPPLSKCSFLQGCNLFSSAEEENLPAL